MKKLYKKRKKMMEKIVECDSMLKGTIKSVCQKCARANCICSPKGKIKAYRLCFIDYEKEKSKHKTIYIPKQLVKKTEKQVAQFKNVRNIIAELIKVNQEIFKLEAKQQK